MVRLSEGPREEIRSVTTLYLLGVLFLLVVLIAWIAWRAGQTKAEKDSAKTSLKIKDKQLEAVLDRPTKPSLLDRLRDGKF